MTFDQALTELGLTTSADAATARRAYLKLIKVRKPESDPGGFQRAREAFERITAQLENGSAQAYFLAPAPAATPLSTAGPEAPPPPAATLLPAAAGPERVAPQSAEEFRAQFAALPPGASVEAALAIARRAVAALPESEEALHWLVQALVSADRHAEAIEELRQAVAVQPTALFVLALRFPTALTDAELLQLGGSAPPRLLWALVDNYCSLDLGDRAAAVALWAFEAQAREPQTTPPPPDWLGLLVIRLHEAGAPAAARQIAERYERWLREQDLFEVFSQDVVGERWPLVLDLGKLPDDFPRLARSPLARAIAEGSHSLAGTFTEYARHDPEAARRVQEQIRTFAPQLAFAFRVELRALAGFSVASVTRGAVVKPFAILVVAVVVTLGGFRLLNALLASAEGQSVTVANKVEMVVSNACANVPSAGDEVCEKAGEVAAAFTDQGCLPDSDARVARVEKLIAEFKPTTWEERDFLLHAKGMVVELRSQQIMECGGSNGR